MIRIRKNRKVSGATKRKLSRGAPHHIRLGVWLHRQKLATRIACFSFALLIGFGIFSQFLTQLLVDANYSLSPEATELIGKSNPTLAQSLKYDPKKGTYEFNEDYQPSAEVAGSSGRPRYTASFNKASEKGVTVNDPVSQTAVTFKPEFGMAEAKQDENRLLYPIKGKNAVKVQTLKTVGFKEDIILNSFQGDKQEFTYKLELAPGTEARMEKDGSLAIYGASKALLGNVATGNEKDAELLEKARQNAPKETLLYRFPAPFIKEFNSKSSNATAWFGLEGDKLTVYASGLEKSKYPLTIDPSVYIESAARLMRGNNETNIDFDIDQELIQKSQTTGARIDKWTDTLDMSSSIWDQATVAAGGYVYRAGGQSARIMPRIVDQQKSEQATNSTSFVMNMPAIRPAGDLYVALISHDGTGTITPPAGGGWTEYADIREHAAYYKIGTDQGGGNESASYTWTGATEEWAGVILRIKDFDATDIVSGSVATGSNAADATPVYPSVTPDTQGALVLRASGFDDDVPPSFGWAPTTGHSEVASGNSGGTGDSGYTVDVLDSPPASGVASGTATLSSGSGIFDSYGSSSIAINGVSATPTLQTSLEWARFNTSTGAIESPNPGSGTCSGWCTNSAYNLPEARIGMTMVSYNGFLYALGGSDGTNRESTVWIAKLGANGEPSLWHPTGGTPAYWHVSASTLSNVRSYSSAVAYNNRLYLLGGQSDGGSTGGVTTVEYADLLPTGDIGSWSTTGMQALPDVRNGHSVHVYNDVMYLIGGDSNGTLRDSVYYSKLNSDGTMNPWVQTSNFATARSSRGGTMTGVWGGYIYIAGGCTTVTSGICTAIAGDVQLASINADGTLAEWNTVMNIRNQRIGYSFIAWQNGLYRFGGCSRQDASTGECYATHKGVQYGVINPDGEASTVSISQADGSGNCTGTNPYECHLPPEGDDAGESGQLLPMAVVMNGYLYVVGGCGNPTCTGGDNGSGNISYASIGSSGKLEKPASCVNGYYGAWCVDSTNTVNGTTGVAAAGVTTFGGRIYIIGGVNGAGLNTNLYYISVNSDGSLAGPWTAQDMTGVGIAEDVAYTYAYARANPSSAGTDPGNLYIFGGCGNSASGVGCGNSDYETEVYKCNIATTGAISGCTTNGQLQLDVELATETNQGLGIHSGTVYANYIYMIGGFSPAVSDRDTVFYAKFDNSNNVVDAVSGTANPASNDDDWIESPNTMDVGRRRGFSFGYNGYIYAVGGYEANGSTIIKDIEFAKVNVSDGSIGAFTTSSVSINQRWGLSMAVSNSYAYVIGGCSAGPSPGGCTNLEEAVQTFQLYNNDSGAIAAYAGASDDTFAANTDRWGASSAVYNGYIYVAGGCISATDCTDATNNVQYASLSTSDGSIGTWSSGGSLPADRAWGQLEAVGGTLYYIGGQDDTATNEQSTIYYTTGISSGNPTWSGTAASGGIGDTNSQVAQARTRFGAAVWNNRIYVVGGLDGSAAATSTVYVSPQLSSGGDIAADNWTSSTAFNVARSGAAVVAYANNLYLFGGFDGTNYLSDAQFTQVNADGSVDGWTYTTSLPDRLSQSDGFAANGYLYLFGGRSATSSCAPKTLITPISANTTVATGNNPTGIGEWYETSTKYSGDRYGAAVTYSQGKAYIFGGGCTAPVDGVGESRHYQATLKSQPQVAKYSRMIDTDSDVFPTKWLMNGIDNSVGARWQMRYRSMTDIDGDATDCVTAMTTWGQETNFGAVTLGQPEDYVPRDGSGTNTNCARYFYFSVSIDSSQAFGYPEDVTRGPTINDLSLFFTSDPSKRLRHGKTFTGGELQPLDTPF